MQSRVFLLVFLAASLGARPAQQPAPPPASASAPQSHPLAMPPYSDDYTRTIHLLETGVQRHWDQEHLRKAFADADGPRVLTGERLTPCGVGLVFLLKPRTPWDEQLPVPFIQRVKQTIADCQKQHAWMEKLRSSQQ